MVGGAPATDLPGAETCRGFDNRENFQSHPQPLPKQAGRMPGTTGSPNLGTHQFHTMFCIGQRVVIDGDQSAHAVVTEILIKAGGVIYRVAWVQNGESKEPWFDEFRLSAAPVTDR